jgi:hypothetical protein
MPCYEKFCSNLHYYHLTIICSLRAMSKEHGKHKESSGKDWPALMQITEEWRSGDRQPSVKPENTP